MESSQVRIREGGADDVPAVFAMLDGAVAWLVAHGRDGQWGTGPISARPKAVQQVQGYLDQGTLWIADIDGAVAGAVILTSAPGPSIAPADEPEVYVHFLVNDRRFAGRGVGSALLEHAAAETVRQGVSLLRVDCYAGSGGALVAYYERNGFTRTEAFSEGDWPGQILARRV
ncbi:GNAT family N-acetyltransferase [Streptomyces sp. NBC_01766]|uniref:GNAT family N-acetyltransferase n=1 Tax=Streptomyces sp. NBC_01766 TaxID=2975936 RepID=UPI002DD94FAB|nr:GNAT family N-acetyltransferase [Streptomyces sp. NBC_01766]WSC21628.1 GNAT family N-acetyltransferase [Streptomyces sp. NBC_01766]